jgi:hypothetical protein
LNNGARTFFILALSVGELGNYGWLAGRRRRLDGAKDYQLKLLMVNESVCLLTVENSSSHY